MRFRAQHFILRLAAVFRPARLRAGAASLVAAMLQPVCGRTGWASLVAVSLLIPSVGRASAPFIWDQDTDRIDDRIESVHLLGFQFSFEDADSLLRQRFEVVRIAGALVYSVYVVYKQPPTATDLTTLTLLGMPVLARYDAVPAVRSVATFAQVQAAAALLSVERVEAVALSYPEVRDGCAAIGLRDPLQSVFPTWADRSAVQGQGVVVAFLDSGINDAPEATYPGHESLAGRALGGAQFTAADSALNTPKSGSVNPSDHGGVITASHGTHVAGIAVGSGGPAQYAQGVAPQAGFVDVKVLNDAGVGMGIADALDWCIANRARNWGSPNPDLRGIDVINASTSSLDYSDGNDVVARLAARAVELGIVVVASMGNDGVAGLVPAPASGDGVLAVGAMDDQRTGRADDDLYPSFDNSGPRPSDGDGNALDELKPDLLAPGVAVLSADGSLTSDGAQYQRLSGTSMGTAFVSGAAALLKSLHPTWTPAQIAERLHATARRELNGAPPGTTGPDPRWNSVLGYGVLDVYAALIETLDPSYSQVRRLIVNTSLDRVDLELWTQRERGAAYFAFERAPDVSGVPGTFAAFDSAAAAGDSSLADPTNLTRYTASLTLDPSDRGVPFWYRVAFTEGGQRHTSLARRVAGPAGPSVATVDVRIAHNAFDTDISAQVVAGQPGAGGPSFPLGGTSAAISSDWVSGTALNGNIEWHFRVEIPAGAADAYLPLDASNPWELRVDEGGFLNRSGRVTDFKVTWHGPGGDVTYTGAPLPAATVEGTTTWVIAPQGALAAAAPTPRVSLRFGPSPVRAGAWVTFVVANPSEKLRVFDLSGREVGSARFEGPPSAAIARWKAARADGAAIAPGLYFAETSPTDRVRIIVLPH